MKAKSIGFCVRLKDNWWLTVKDFVESADQERIATFSLPKKDRSKLAELKEMWEDVIQCRIIKVTLENGDIEVLCTSLLDNIEKFRQLYHYRWNEEEAYKLLKSRIELDKFSGKTAQAEKQDFYAKVFLMTLRAAYAHPIEEKITAEYNADQNRKHAQKINRTHALATMMDLAIPMFVKKKFNEALHLFDNLVYNTCEIIRPNRKVHRPKKTTPLQLQTTLSLNKTTVNLNVLKSKG